MKTKEQAAREYAGCYLSIEIPCNKCPYCHSGCAKKTKSNTFLAGIDFAEEWIPVEKELPEDGKEVFLKRVLNDGSFKYSAGCLYGAMFNKCWYVDRVFTVLDFYDFWKPINKK